MISLPTSEIAHARGAPHELSVAVAIAARRIEHRRTALCDGRLFGNHRRHFQIQNRRQPERRVAAVVVQRIVIAGVRVNAPHVVRGDDRMQSELLDIFVGDIHDHAGKRGGLFLLQIESELRGSGILLDLSDEKGSMIARGVANAIDVVIDHVDQGRRKARFNHVKRRLYDQLTGQFFSFHYRHGRPIRMRAYSGKSETQILTGGHTSLVNETRNSRRFFFECASLLYAIPDVSQDCEKYISLQRVAVYLTGSTGRISW
jgi:hypothetical protein